MKLFDKIEPIYFIDNDIIERVGSDKTGYWEILK